MGGMKNSTKRLARLAILTALGVVVILLANVLPTGDLWLLAVSSFAVCVARMMYGYGWAAAVYGVTAALGLLIFPGVSSIAYVLFFGYYPLAKSLFERLKKRAGGWALKYILYTVLFAVYWRLAGIFFPAETTLAWYFLYPLGAVAFGLYDWCLTLLIGFYIQRLARYFT